MTAELCPRCGRKMDLRADKWICAYHEPPEWVSVHDPADVPPYVDELPSPLAVSIRDYFQSIPAGPEFMVLQRMCDAAELVTRFMAIIGLAVARRSGFPDHLAQVVGDRLRRPTFGQWRNILKAALKCEGSSMLGEVRDFTEQSLLPLLGSGNGDRNKHVLALRNHIAHAGRLPDEEAVQLVRSHREPFERTLEGLEFLAASSLVACCRDGREILLRGHDWPARRLGDRVNSELQPGRVYLRHSDETLDLFPLQFYETISQRQDAPSDSAPHVYFRFNKQNHALEFTSFGGHSHGLLEGEEAVQEFLKGFDQAAFVEAKQRTSGAGRLWKERGYDFRDVRDRLREGFGWRNEQVKKAKQWVKENSGEGGRLWIGGAPGVGKSAFAAELVTRLEGAELVVPFFFQRGEATCHLDRFYDAACHYLDWKLGGGGGTDAGAPPDRKFHQTLAAAHKQLLEQQTHRRNRTIVFVLDGVDELDAKGASLLLQLPIEHAKERVVWILVGQRTGSTLDSVESGVFDTLWSDGELPPLGPAQVRAFLEKECQRDRYALYEQDESTGDGAYRNRFIDEATRRSGGLPVYLRFLVEDLRVGRQTFSDPTGLPEGLAAYYDQLLRRSGVGTTEAMLLDIAATLSWAREPIREDQLAGILHPLWGEDSEAWPNELEGTLRRSMGLLRQSDSRVAPGWVLFHDSLRDHLRAAPSLRTPSKRALRHLVNWCRGAWKEGDTYALAHAVTHIYEAGEFDAAIDLVDEEFLAKKEARFEGPLRLLEDFETGMKAAGRLGKRAQQLGFLLARAHTRARIESLGRAQLGGARVALVARFGRPQLAVELASSIQDPGDRAKALADVAREIRDTDPIRAVSLVESVLEGAESLDTYHLGAVLDVAAQHFPAAFTECLRTATDLAPFEAMVRYARPSGFSERFEPLMRLIGGLEDQRSRALRTSLHLAYRRIEESPGNRQQLSDALQLVIACREPPAAALGMNLSCPVAAVVLEARRQRAGTGAISEESVRRAASLMVREAVGWRCRAMGRHILMHRRDAIRLLAEAADGDDRMDVASTLLQLAIVVVQEGGDLDWAIELMRSAHVRGLSENDHLLIVPDLVGALHAQTTADDVVARLRGIVAGDSVQLLAALARRDPDWALARCGTPAPLGVVVSVATTNLERALELLNAGRHRRAPKEWLSDVLQAAGPEAGSRALDLLLSEVAQSPRRLYKAYGYLAAGRSVASEAPEQADAWAEAALTLVRQEGRREVGAGSGWRSLNRDLALWFARHDFTQQAASVLFESDWRVVPAAVAAMKLPAGGNSKSAENLRAVLAIAGDDGPPHSCSEEVSSLIAAALLSEPTLRLFGHFVQFSTMDVSRWRELLRALRLVAGGHLDAATEPEAAMAAKANARGGPAESEGEQSGAIVGDPLLHDIALAEMARTGHLDSGRAAELTQLIKRQAVRLLALTWRLERETSPNLEEQLARELPEIELPADPFDVAVLLDVCRGLQRLFPEAHAVLLERLGVEPLLARTTEARNVYKLLDQLEPGLGIPSTVREHLVSASRQRLTDAEEALLSGGGPSEPDRYQLFADEYSSLARSVARVDHGVAQQCCERALDHAQRSGRQKVLERTKSAAVQVLALQPESWERALEVALTSSTAPFDVIEQLAAGAAIGAGDPDAWTAVLRGLEWAERVASGRGKPGE